MKSFNTLCILGALLLMAACCAGESYKQAPPYDVNDINRIVEQLKRSKSDRVRYDLSIKLTEAMRLSDHNEIDDKTIDHIAGLLVIKDDSLRGWTALALGQAGPKARRALPALDSALGEVRAFEREYIVRLGRDSGDDICDAFYMIGGQKEVDKHDCRINAQEPRASHYDPDHIHFKSPTYEQ